MDDTELYDEIDTEEAQAHERRMKRAFGDDVAQRFLQLRGVADERAQQALVERYYQRQAAKAHASGPQT